MADRMPDDALLDAARAWYDAGYCVIPAHEDGSKRPFGPWKRYQQQRPTWDQTASWLASGQYTGIGVITGAVSGDAEMIEIEGPVESSAHALHALKDAAIRLDCSKLLDDLMLGCNERTGGGGLHLFLRVTDGPAMPNTKLATAIDGKVIAETRGEGGFVIVAPTPARKGHADGSVYAFIAGTTPASTIHVTSTQRDLLHQLFTIALHHGTPEPPPAIQARPAPPPSSDGLTPWDDYATRTTWADILTPEGWQPVFVAPDGRTHWTRPGKSPADGTSATSLEDGPLYVFSTSTTLPVGKGMSKQYVYAHLHHGGDLAAAARALAAAGYGDPLPAAPPLPAWQPDIDPAAIAEQRSALIRERFPALDWHRLWADDVEEEWIVEPLLPARRLIALYSAPKAGKSLLMLEIAAAIVTRTPMFGYPAGPARRVLYVDFENDPRGDIRTRLQAMDYRPEQLDGLCYLSFPTMSALDTDAGGQELLAAAAEYGCDVVVIDTVSRSVRGEENENDTWLAFYRHTGLRLKQAGIALIRLDHSGKDESKGQRGGSAKSGDVDAIWRLKVSTDSRLDLECEAARFPIMDKRLVLRREDSPLRHVSTKDTYRDKVGELHERMEDEQVPKIADMTVRAMRIRMKEAGIRFDNSIVTRGFIESYCARLTRFVQPEMGLE